MTAIIVAAGSGRRMGFDKLIATLAGQPVLVHSARAFDQCAEADHIIIVTDPERFALVEAAGLSTRLTRVDGGVERHHSVAHGLAAAAPDTDFIAVHDGARPLITPEGISHCLAAARKCGAAACAHPVTETVKRADADGYVTEPVSRENLWAMETPQTFRADLLRRAYAHVESANALVTDEVSALELIGTRTQLVATPSPNPKITYPGDLVLAEQLLKR